MRHRSVVGVLLTTSLVVASLLVGQPAGAVPPPPITGTVTGPGDLPVEGATVRAHVFGCSATSGEVAGAIRDEATTASDGTYVLDVGTDCYYVEVVPPGASGLATGWWGGAGAPTYPTRPELLAWLAITGVGSHEQPLAIPGTDADIVLGVPVHLSGVVTFEGEPVEGATVRVGARPPLGVATESQVHEVAAEVLTDAAGGWVLDGFGAATWAVDVVPPLGSDAARTFGSGCTAPPLYLATLFSFGDEISPWPQIPSSCLGGAFVASASSATLDAALVAGAAIEGVVRTSDGAPVPGTEVSVLAAQCAGSTGLYIRRRLADVTAADGSYRISGLPPGGMQHLSFAPPDGSVLIAEGGDGWYAAYCGTFPELVLSSGQELVQSPVLEARCDGPAPFTDVADGDGARALATCGEVAWLADAGITTGWPDGTFRPSSLLSRGAWITWLWRHEGSPTGPYPDPGFRDVEPGSLFHPAVAWAVATGVATGYADGTFGAGRPVTVQAALVMVWRDAGSPTSPTTVHPVTAGVAGASWDPPLTNPFRTPIRWGLASNLITPDVLGAVCLEPNGTGPSSPWCDGIDPGDPASRAMATSILHDATARAPS